MLHLVMLTLHSESIKQQQLTEKISTVLELLTTSQFLYVAQFSQNCDSENLFSFFHSTTAVSKVKSIKTSK